MSVVACVQFLTEPDYESKKALEIAGLEKTIQMQKDVSRVTLQYSVQTRHHHCS